MRRVALAAASLALAAAAAAACGAAARPAVTDGAATTSRVSAGVPVLTQRDHGRTVTLRLGRTATLRVRGGGAPKARGAAVQLAEVLYFADPGFREWELRAARVGRTVLTAPRARGGSFTVTVRVVA